MHRRWSWVLIGLVWVGTLPAQETGDRVVQESWDAVYLEGARAGHYHTLIRQQKRGEKTVLVTTVSMDLKVRRYSSVVPLRMAISTEETPEGEVLALSMTHFLDRGQVVVKGTVEDGKLLVQPPGAPLAQVVPWNPEVIGLARQEQLYKLKKVKPGDRLSFRSYELSLLAPLTLHATVGEPENVDLLVTRQEGEKTVVDRKATSLLRVEVRSEPVTVGENQIQLPMQVVWLDESWQPVRSEIGLPGLGRATLYRTTREIALQPGAAPELLPDLGLNSIVALDRRIPNPHGSSRILYRIQYTGEEDPATLFTRDARQQVARVVGKVLDLEVKAARAPAEVKTGEVEPAYLQSSHFLDSSSDVVKAAALQAVGEERDPWKRARRIEAWVHDRMRSASDVGFSTASQVAEDLRGDCRQHAMLTAAMCRAAGIPARTALGLVYGEDPQRGPMLVFHMWTEVWIAGQWLGLDATLGRGSIGPAHLKISDHSWQDVRTLAPMLTPLRVMGKIKVEIAEVE